MRQPLIAGNWKMFKTVHEAVVHVKELRSVVKAVTGVEIVVAPPFTALHAVAEAARNSNIAVAGQHCHWERDGAFTGEVSAAMVREAGAEYVIIGHSERRALFGETDDTVNLRTRAALAAGPGADCLRRRDARAARRRPDAGHRRPAVAARARRRVRRPGGGDGRGLRAGVGHRHRPQRHSRAGRRGPRAPPHAAAVVVGGAGRRSSATSSTAAA